MPKGFAFPVSHRFWIPLREDRLENLPALPEAAVFARLRSGVSLEKARSELASLGLLPVPGAPESHEQRRAFIESYTFALTADGDRGQALWLVRLILVLVILLVVPPCANIAILVYARTISRQQEFASRHALGASRGRVVGQLFVEMLVLAALAAAVALVIVGLGLRWAKGYLVESSGGIPFWMDVSLSFQAVLFAAGLALVAATIAGLVPALKATGRQMQSGLHGLGGGTATKLGPTWTLLVVFQVAISLAALPAAVEIGWGTVRKGVLGPGFAAEKYLTARLAMDSEIAAGIAREPNRAMGGTETPFSRFGVLQEKLVQQLRNEPGILGVTLAALPGDEPWKKIEIERKPGPKLAPRDELLPTRSLVQVNSVDAAFFEVFGIEPLTGRGFEAGDFDLGRTPVIVNRAFVKQLMGEESPLGHRLRYLQSPAEENSAAPVSKDWYEIVGIVEDRPANATHGTVYHPRRVGEADSTSLALLVGADPAGQADRLRQISRSLDPALRLSQISSLDEIYREKAVGNNIGALSLAAVTLSVLLLSAAGMYALLAFTISKRRREIGIRAALGAQPRRLLTSILQRVLFQLAAGMIVGISVALLLDYLLPAEEVGGWSVPGVIPATTVFMMIVGLLAAVGPARRGLQVDPIEELRNG